MSRDNYRPDWAETYFTIAQTLAQRSTCLRRHVGAILVNQQHQILATGYNGAPRGLPHCIEEGCYIEGEGTLAHCIRAVHAEVNAVVQAAVTGVATAQSILYCTHHPCHRCAQILIQAQVAAVHHLGPLELTARKALTSAGIIVISYDL